MTYVCKVWCRKSSFSPTLPKWLVVHSPPRRLLCFCSVDQGSAGRVAGSKLLSTPSYPLFCFLQRGIGVFPPPPPPPIIFSGYCLSPVHTPHWQCTTILLCLVHRIKNQQSCAAMPSRLFVIPACWLRPPTAWPLWMGQLAYCVGNLFESK